MASRINTKSAASTAAKTTTSTSGNRPPHDNYWSYALITLMKCQLGKTTDGDFMNKLLGILKMGPENKAKMPTAEDVDMEFSEETIREFETRYSDIKPVGPIEESRLSNTMTRRMALFLKLHLKGVKNIKITSITSHHAFIMRGSPYTCESTGLLIYIDKAMMIGKVTQIISADVLAFASDDQPESEATKHTFIFGLLVPLRKGNFGPEEIYPLGWYATIVRPVGFEEHEGEWYSYNYQIEDDLDDE